MSKQLDQALILALDPDACRQRTGGVANLKRVVLTLGRASVTRCVIAAPEPALSSLRALLEGDAADTYAETDAVGSAQRSLTWVAVPEDATASDAARQASSRLDASEEAVLIDADRVFHPRVIDALAEAEGSAAILAEDGAWARIAKMTPGELAAGGALEERIAPLTPVEADFVHSTHEPREARKALLNALRKPAVDGLISRNINRPFSLFLTRWLMNTPVRPNHVTFFTLLVSIAAGLAGALATAQSAYLLAVCGLGWQLASMLDGVDGEIARLKFQTSPRGEWFDTLVDDSGRVFVFLGAGYGYSVVSGNMLWFYLMIGTVAMQLYNTLQVYREMRRVGVGSHFGLAWTDDREAPTETTFWSRFWQRIEFMGRRDYYIFLFASLTVVGLTHIGLILSTATSTVIFFHELVWPRTARDRDVVQAVVVRDEVS